MNMNTSYVCEIIKGGSYMHVYIIYLETSLLYIHLYRGTYRDIETSQDRHNRE